ncbi:hypothetical protein M409DRAFT_51954 [Zasmidium cellare ATCC 36951]|uniref:SnoaL-like domain-containing protein n=1 Tax=Zasmidium cellare ATCC 36951 TaxID=1080233 RepID=A0A6A6CSY3_ZASCE|nr:uncharacterized protein M409DRAFT_51954 [Zasmidium cellare ATCC 36951]KAF2170211.1 hypothetical protein M409DRAFT_51954 [Zasmidium cellare ATCC 36951]
MSTESPPPRPADESDEDQTYLEVLNYTSTARYLEDLCRRLMAEYLSPNFRNSSFINRHVHKDFTWNDAGTMLGDGPLPHFRGRQDHFKVWEKFQQENPTYVAEAYNYTAKVHRGTRTAEVYFTTLEKWMSNGRLVTRESCGVSFWERQPEDDTVPCEAEAALGFGEAIKASSTEPVVAHVELTAPYNSLWVSFNLSNTADRRQCEPPAGPHLQSRSL